MWSLRHDLFLQFELALHKDAVGADERRRNGVLRERRHPQSAFTVETALNADASVQEQNEARIRNPGVNRPTSRQYIDRALVSVTRFKLIPGLRPITWRRAGCRGAVDFSLGPLEAFEASGQGS
ncbi:hypothetical protein C6401_13965 [Arthrobacter woluwensis]|nr:hypothetical protein C6401_13965 [Arthrobacter woluwensis]